MKDYKVSFQGMREFELELQRRHNIRFDAIIKKSATQMLNRARAKGGTPVDSGELRKHTGICKDTFGYEEEYAPHVEYGHRTRGGRYVSGQRFLQKNVKAQREIYEQDLKNALKKG